MGREEAKLVRQRILDSIEDYERLREITKGLGVDTSYLGRGRRSRGDYRFAIEHDCGGDFGRVLEALSSDELTRAHEVVLHKGARGRQKCIDALLPWVSGTVACYLEPSRTRADTPEERVRQAFTRRLHETYGYAKEDMVLEFPLQRASGAADRLDIAIFNRRSRHQGERKSTNIYIVVECKRPDLSASNYEKAKRQLQSYLDSCTNVRFGILTTGQKTHVFRKVKEKIDGQNGEYDYVDLREIPHASQDAPPLTVFAEHRPHALAAAVAAAPPAPVAQPSALTPQQRWAAAWDRLHREPGHYLKADASKFTERGLFSKTREVCELVIRNESPFPVQNVTGAITWMEDNNTASGVVPFATRGVVPPGQAVGFALAAGNLASTALATKASRALAVCTAFEAVPWR